MIQGALWRQKIQNRSLRHSLRKICSYRLKRRNSLSVVRLSVEGPVTLRHPIARILLLSGEDLSELVQSMWTR